MAIIIRTGGGGGGASDNLTLPPQIRNFAATAGNAKVYLSWQIPELTDDYEGLAITRKVGSYPSKVSDGVKITLSNAATSYEDTGLTNDTTYYYRAFPFNAKGQYQTELGGAVASAKPVVFIVPIFTGQHAIFGDETQGRIECYSSGELTLDSREYDVFLVGGGGAAGYTGGAGGGGGYTKTVLKREMEGITYSVIVGSGGTKLSGGGGNAGGASSVDNISATGGMNSSNSTPSAKGGDGGSGGGGGHYETTGPGGNGGSNGSNGTGYYGIGQGVTTRDFGETTGALRSGGGGGAQRKSKDDGPFPMGRGGEGGGGDSTKNSTPNTGGGGGTSSVSSNGYGASGIIIIRWGY